MICTLNYHSFNNKDRSILPLHFQLTVGSSRRFNDRAALPARGPGDPRGPRLPRSNAAPASFRSSGATAAPPHAVDEQRRAAHLHLSGQLLVDLEIGLTIMFPFESIRPRILKVPGSSDGH